MAYVTKTQLLTVISANDYNTWFDDLNTQDQTTIEANFANAASFASTQVDAYLAGIYDVPFATPGPVACQAAALAFLCEMLYSKRYTPNQVNPWSERAARYRAILEDIRENGSGLDHTIDRDFDVGFVVTTPLIFGNSQASL
jgi:hypothetical protein